MEQLDRLGIHLQHLAHFGVNISSERKGGIALVDEVVGETGGHETAVHVEHGLERGPRHASDGRGAGEVGAEDKGIADKITGIAELITNEGGIGAVLLELGKVRKTKFEVHVRRVHISETLDAEAIPADITVFEFSGAAKTDGEIKRLGGLDQITIGQHRDGAVGVGDPDIVEPERGVE